MTALDTQPDTRLDTSLDTRLDAGAVTWNGPDDHDAPLLPVVGRQLEVPLVTGESAPHTNLDYAASAPCLRSVADHLDEVLPFYASVHRGAGYASQVCTTLYESARKTVATFVGARADDVVVFTRNTNDALNLLAGCLPPSTEADPHLHPATTPGGAGAATAGAATAGRVLFLDVEHHANFLPWQAGEHRCVLAGTTQRATLVGLRAELAARPTALLAITGASNVTGEVLPLEQIVEVAHTYGARVVLDAAQLAPHRRIDLATSGVDYVAFSGHKMYAPLGAGVLVGRRDWLDAAPPYLRGGGAVRSVGADRTEWAAAPQRHEGGTPNVLGAAALARACRALTELPEGALEAHEARLREHLLRRLAAFGDKVRVHRIWRDSPDAIGVVAFSVEGYHPGLVATALSAEHGIGVRDGKFCAHPLLSRLGAPDGAVRASFGVGTTMADIDRLADAVGTLLADGPRWAYRVEAGRHVPDPDPRPAPPWAAPIGADLAGDVGGSPCEPGFAQDDL